VHSRAQCCKNNSDNPADWAYMQLVNENDEQTNMVKQRTVLTFTLIILQANRMYREENIK